VSGQRAPLPAAEPDLFDTQLLRQSIGFVFRGVRRHRVLALLTFAALLSLGVLAAVLMPRTYHVESRLLANNNQLIRALGNPRSSLREEDPTRAARELIFAHDNLVSLIKQTNLMKSWEETRPAIVRGKDRLVQLVSGPMSEDDQIDAMVGLLEKKLRVSTDQQTVTISVDWNDAQLAYLIVETAQQNFLETRHVTEMTAISEALSILEMHGGQFQKMVDDALHELERVREQRRKGGSGVAAADRGLEAPSQPIAPPVVTPMSNLPEPAVRGPTATEQELAQLKFLLNSKKRALGDLEDFRNRRVNELSAQLAEQKVQYADQHPVVLDTVQRIAALKFDSPQMAQVKADIDALEHDFRRKGGRDPDALVEPARLRSVARRSPVPQAALSNSELSDDPLVEFAGNNLRVAAAKFEELLMRIDSARIEQDTARAAFKYRYSVVRPASVPRKPVKPDVAVLLGLSMVGALFGAVVVGALRDWSSGRLVEPWQVERTLGLPVLSRVTQP
jgi:uncharacterized protein involved in exopolysaccharide biosynthesis